MSEPELIPTSCEPPDLSRRLVRETTEETAGINPVAHNANLPSRESNPFATCWTRPGAIPFQFPAGDSADELVARLAANGWWGEIVGPHGSGKSTLLEALKPKLRDAGFTIESIQLRDGQRRLPAEFFKWASEMASNSQDAKTLLIVDGYEQLGWLARASLKRRCRRAGAGLLVTSHAPTGLPTLITLAPDLPLVEQLVAALCTRAPSITPADVTASHAAHGSNVRDIFFDLYDRYEQRRTAN